MENLSTISSEEELMKLREEGKINQIEYEELHTAMVQQSNKRSSDDLSLEVDKPKPKTKLGILAFVLMLIGFILPVILWSLAESEAQANQPPNPNVEMHGAIANVEMHVSIAFFLFLGVAFEIAAFVLGIIAWSSAFGKAVVISIASILVLFVLSVVLFAS